jgi:hypothetical protein
MIKSLGTRTAAAFLVLFGPAFSQDLGTDAVPITIVPSAIAYIPPVALAVLQNDLEQLSKALDTGEKVDEAVLAKEGARAGFTPLILAAALSEPGIARLLMKRGSKVAVLDDFHRSAFWYAALRGNVEITQMMTNARGARDVINAADDDLKRTPLHIAVRGDEPELVTTLLKSGASLVEKDILGETPGDYCKRHGTDACRALR